MSKKSTSYSSNVSSDNTSNLKSTDNYTYDTNIQNNINEQQNFTDSINRSLEQTKDNINRSIEESRNQIPQYNSIVNNYQEQALQTAKEISENFIESQKTIINSIQSAWRPFSQNYNTTVNSWISPETAANAYSRFVSTVADNTVTALRTTNNLIFSSLDAYKTTLQHAKDTTKQIIDINTKTAQTLEQNTRQITSAAQDAYARNNASYNNRGEGDNTSTSYTTSTPAGTSSSTTSKSTA
ncbi:MAG: hypothetical protein ACTHKK_03170 [Candidatus Nitrosocosmicus sp.]